MRTSFFVCATATALLLNGCPATRDKNGSDAALDATPDAADAGTDSGEARGTIQGVVHKGPFVAGSSVLVSVLDSGLLPTTQTLVTSTDGKGAFDLANVPFGPIRVDCIGSYYNEATGALSDGTLTLRAFFVPGPGLSEVDVNILTHLTAPRVRALVLGGANIEMAASQAETELRDALDITADSIVFSSNGLHARLNGSTNVDALLLALSTVASQVAIDRQATGGGTVHSNLEDVLNTLALDLEDGTIATTYRTEFQLALREIDWPVVATRLSARLTTIGDTATLPDVASVIDTDDDELSDATDNCDRQPNVAQLDIDTDSVGDACDACVGESCRVSFPCRIDSAGTLNCLGKIPGGTWSNPDYESANSSAPFSIVETGLSPSWSVAVTEAGQLVPLGGWTPPFPSTPSDRWAFADIDDSTSAGTVCAITKMGVLRCGSLQNGAPTYAPPPQLAPGRGYWFVSVYGSYACAIDDDGGLHCWGTATQGQTSPPTLPAGVTWIQVSTAYSYACGIGSDRLLRCWGKTSDLQYVPDGTTQWLDFMAMPRVGLRTDNTVMRVGYAGSPSALAIDKSCIVDVTDELLCPTGTGGGFELAGLPGFQNIVWEGVDVSYENVCAYGSNPSVADDLLLFCANAHSAVPFTLPAGATVVDLVARAKGGCVRLSNGEFRCIGPEAAIPAPPAGTTYVHLDASWGSEAALLSDGSLRSIPTFAIQPYPGYSSFSLGMTCTGWLGWGGVRASGTRAEYVIGNTIDVPIKGALNDLSGTGNTYAESEVDFCSYVNRYTTGEFRWSGTAQLSGDFAVAPPSASATWIDLHSAMNGYCGLSSAGDVRCMVANSATTVDPTPSGVIPARPGRNRVQMRSQYLTVCTIDDHGALECWGNTPVRRLAP